MRILTRAMLLSCGVTDTDTVLVALSGGADSTALLDSLCELRREGGVGRVVAAHLHHGIRGEAADADASFCEALCKTRGVRCVVVRADVPAYAARSGQSLEAAARELRYAFLRRAKAACGASCILTAHHRDDQAETFLMHLLRGCGTSGLSGMRPRAGDIARPLLTVSRAEIEAYLIAREIPWRTDETNAEDAATRNRIRHTLLPLLDTFRPDSAKAIAETAMRVSEDEAYLCALAEAAAAEIAENGGYRRDALAALPGPIQTRILRAMLFCTGDDVTRSDIDRVRALLTARTGTRIELSGGRGAWVDSERVYAGAYPQAQAYAVAFAYNGVTRLPCGTLTATPVEAWERTADGNALYVDADALPQDLVVRTRRDGDRFYPLGAPGRRKLSDVLTDKKIPLTRRDMPLLAAGNEIYCVFGLTVSQLAAITPGTRHILHIVYKGEEKA